MQIPPGSARASSSGSDVHAVAVDVAILVDDVTEIDADPQADLLLRGHPGLTLGHAGLQEHGAAHRVDGAAELAQEPVAQELDDAAALLGDERLDELLAVCPKSIERALLVPLHEARVANHVRREHGGEPAIDAGSGHDKASGATSPIG